MYSLLVFILIPALFEGRAVIPPNPSSEPIYIWKVVDVKDGQSVWTRETLSTSTSTSLEKQGKSKLLYYCIFSSYYQNILFYSQIYQRRETELKR